ncbi:hypothetical protein LMG29739_05817 [Paraburkholderia solisilvae]|uniref:Uncharacterized protein n=1 Tax=Paraburkholderia solisilvae TaxID=624376 RepID=A0A6J5EVH0_9BURK|nr:hypothetical protein LMG29739_05817 [Paraburkholderia solisilvae]
MAHAGSGWEAAWKRLASGRASRRGAGRRRVGRRGGRADAAPGSYMRTVWLFRRFARQAWMAAI